MMTGGNIAAEFHAAAIDRLEAPFLLDGKRTWTYGEFFDQVRVFAAALVDAGAQPGDRVLVQVENELPDTDKTYVEWCGTMAHAALDAAKVDVPVTMCNGETASTATVDGDNGLGLIVGPKANQVAMDKAAACGSG